MKLNGSTALYGSAYTSISWPTLCEPIVRPLASREKFVSGTLIHPKSVQKTFPQVPKADGLLNPAKRIMTICHMWVFNVGFVNEFRFSGKQLFKHEANQ
jgi:hypothetical protein